MDRARVHEPLVRAFFTAHVREGHVRVNEAGGADVRNAWHAPGSGADSDAEDASDDEGELTRGARGRARAPARARAVPPPPPGR